MFIFYQGQLLLPSFLRHLENNLGFRIHSPIKLQKVSAKFLCTFKLFLYLLKLVGCSKNVANAHIFIVDYLLEPVLYGLSPIIFPLQFVDVIL